LVDLWRAFTQLATSISRGARVGGLVPGGWFLDEGGEEFGIEHSAQPPGHLAIEVDPEYGEQFECFLGIIAAERPSLERLDVPLFEPPGPDSHQQSNSAHYFVEEREFELISDGCGAVSKD
jgi:hypothetical protein